MPDHTFTQNRCWYARGHVKCGLSVAHTWEFCVLKRSSNENIASSVNSTTKDIRLHHPLAEVQAEKRACRIKACTWRKWRECKLYFNTLQTIWWLTFTWWATILVFDSGLSAAVFKMFSSGIGLCTALRRAATCLVRWNEAVSLNWRYNSWKILWYVIQETARDIFVAQFCSYHLHGHTRNVCQLFRHT